MGITKKVFKMCYVVGKSVVAGTPASVICWKALKQCFRDIAAEDIPSLACKTALIACSPGLGVVAVGAFGSVQTIRNLSKAAKTMVNIAAIAYTGPANVADICLAPVESVLFGEAVPVGNGGFLLLGK